MKTKYILPMLFASLLLNAFLGGMMLSNYLHGGSMPFGQFGPMGNKGDRPPGMEVMIFKRLNDQSEKISPEGRTKVEGIVEKYQKVAEKNGMGDKRHFFDDVQATMTAPKFDKAKMEKIHKELNANETKLKESVGLMMIEIASTLSDEDRIQFFQGLFPHLPDMDKARSDDHDAPKPEAHDEFKK
jgi:Spy/CpxP family protein refolding chaperone